jgi:hypothetical protein
MTNRREALRLAVAGGLALPALASRGGSEAAVAATGHFIDALGGVGTFAGTFTIERFVNQNGALAAVGKVSGKLTNSVGATLGAATSTQQVVPAVITQQTCTVLVLELGPLHLELLGLVIDLNRVVLTITADPSGGILGQLLCALAGGIGGTLVDNIVHFVESHPSPFWIRVIPSKLISEAISGQMQRQSGRSHQR